MAFLQLCGEIQLQGKTRIGLLITVWRASRELPSAPSRQVANLPLSQTCSGSRGGGVLCELVRGCGENYLLQIFFIVTVSSFLVPCCCCCFSNVHRTVWERKPRQVARTHAHTHSHTRSRVHTHSQADRFLPNLGFFPPSLPAIPRGLERPCRVGNPKNHISKAPVPRADG